MKIPSSIMLGTEENSSSSFKIPLGKETLDDLENDDSYINIASRFLKGIGEKENDVDDLYEYFRDADWNLASGANRAFNELPNFNDQQKKDYKYLKQRFDKADTGSMSQYLSAARDIGIDIVTDPMSILSALFVPLTGGASVATRAALGEATRMGLKQVGKGFAQSKPLMAVAKKEKIEPVQKGVALVKTKLARKQAIQKYYKDQVKYYGTLGAAEGSIWTGMDEYLRQERDDVDGIDLRYGMDYADIGLSAAMGGILGGAFGAVPTKLGQKFSPEVRNSLHKFADETQLDESDLIFRANKAKDILISNTIGKPTTRLKTISKYSPTLQKLLTTFRYDTYKGIEDVDLEAVRKGKEPITRSYKETADDYEGSYMVAYEDAVRPLLKGKKLTKKDEQILTELMRSKEAEEALKKDSEGKFFNSFDKQKQIIKKLFPNVSMDHINTYQAVRNLSNKVLGDGHKVGIYRQPLKAGPNAWFPRRWKWSVVDEDRDELAKIMVDSNAVVIDDNIALELIDESNKENLSGLIGLENNITDLIENAGKKNYEDIIEIARSYGINIPNETMRRTVGDAQATLVTFGQQLIDVRNTKRELINAIPNSKRLSDEKYKTANNVIDEMLGKKDLLHQIDGDTLGTMFPSSFSPRNLFMLDDKNISKFIDDDFDLLMRDYFSSSAKLYARKKLFGANVDEFKERFIDDIRDELKTAGGSLKGKDAEELVKIYEYATGLNQQGFNSNVANTLADYSKLSQQLAHLPLATLSSLTEMLIPLTRVDADIYAKGVGNAFKNASTSFYDNTKKLLQDDHNLGREEAHREMHRVMLGLEQAIAQRIDSLSGEGVQSPLARKIQNVFFKGNLLSQWTRTVQLAAFTMGKDMITRNLETIKKFETKGIKNLTKFEKLKLDDATLQLYDLDVDINRGKTWIDRGKSKYHKIEDNLTGMKKWDDFYENHIMKGAARFANEVILDPSKAAVTRPHAQQHPVGTILFQFLGYPTAFTNTVLKNYYTQMKRNPVTGTAKVGSVALLMTGVATGLNAIRSNGESLEKEPNEIILDSVSRWGGLGFGEYIQNIRKNQEIGGGTLGSVAKGISGPIVGDVVDSILYRKGPNEFLMTNMPGYSALDMASSGIKAVTGDEVDIKGNLKSLAREQDYNIDVGLGIRKPREPVNPYTVETKYSRDELKLMRGYAEAGLVTEEGKGITKNPSTKIDKMTGVPYSEQAGDIIEDREEFAIGGFAKLAKETLSSILNISSKEIDEDPRLNYTNKLFLNQKDIEEDPLDDFTGLTIEQGPEEQLRIKNLMLDDSEFKDDYVHIRNPEADERTLMSRVTPMEYKEEEIGSNLYNYKGTPYNEVTSNDVLLRASRSLDYEGDIPNAPFLLVYDDKFLNVFQNLETKKALNSIRKDYEKELEQIKQIDNLDTKYPEFDSTYFAQKILSKYNDKFSNVLLNEGYDVIGYFPKSQTNLSKELTDIQGSYVIDKILTAKGTEDKSKSVKDALGIYSPEELQELINLESISRARKDKEIQDTYETIERVNPKTNQTFKQRIKLPEEIKAEYEKDKDVPLEIFKREETGYEDLVGPTDPEIDDPVERMAEPVYKITDGIRRKRSYILLNPEAQLINLHKTAKPSQKEIDFVNARPTQEKIDFINEGNVTNLPVKAITNILDNKKTFHMVSTASSATDMGQIISYHPLTNKFLRDVRNSIDIGSDLPVVEFTATSFNVPEASIDPSGMIRMDLEGPYGIINRIKTGRMKIKFEALLEEGKYSPEDADTSYFNIGDTGNPKEDYKEVIDFIIFHERAHNRIKRKPNEDSNNYEKRINQVAIAKLKQQATYEKLVEVLNKQSKTEDMKYIRMDTFGGQEVPVLYNNVYTKENVVNLVKNNAGQPSKLWFHPLDNNILNPLARHWRLLNIEDQDILNRLEPDTIRKYIEEQDEIKLHKHEANKNRFVSDVYQRLGEQGQVEEEIKLGGGKLGLADVAEELDRNLKMEKRYDDLVPQKSAILYKRGRTWTRTPPPRIETGLTPQTNPQVTIASPTKQQAKVAVLKNTEGLNDLEIELVSQAWLYEETGGGAGDYQPLKRYVEENLPFSKGAGTQAFIRDLISEFSAEPEVRGRLAKVLRRKTKVKSVGNISYKDFSQGSLVHALRKRNNFGGFIKKSSNIYSNLQASVANELGISNEDFKWANNLGQSYSPKASNKTGGVDTKGDAARHMALGYLIKQSNYPKTANALNTVREWVTDPRGRSMDVHNNDLGFNLKATTKAQAEKEISNLFSKNKPIFYNPEQIRRRRRDIFNEGGLLDNIKLFGEEGLIFDHTNPMDYLMFVPGLGAIGVGAKALDKLNKLNKLKKLPKTQWHGGHSSVEKKAADKVGIYSSPDDGYARAFKDRYPEAIKKYGETGVYKLDLSGAKNIELTDKPSRKLLKAVKEKIKEDPTAPIAYHLKSFFVDKKERKFGVRGSKPHRRSKYYDDSSGNTKEFSGQETLDWLRNQGVEILTDSKTLQKGSKAKSTDAEYYLLKDFPKRKISDKEEYDLLLKGVKERKIKELESQNKLMGKSFKPLFNEGGEVSNNLQNFLDVANKAIQFERRGYEEGGLLNRLKQEPSMKIEKLINGEPEEIYLEFGKKNIKPDVRGIRYPKNSHLPAQQYRPSQTLTDSMGQKWEDTPANKESIRIENNNASKIATYFNDWNNKRTEEHIKNMSNQEFLDGYGLEAKREEVIKEAYERNQRRPKHTAEKVIKDFNESAFPLQNFIDARVIENDILNVRNKQKSLTMDEWHKWSQSRFGLNSGGLLNRLKRKSA